MGDDRYKQMVGIYATEELAKAAELNLAIRFNDYNYWVEEWDVGEK